MRFLPVFALVLLFALPAAAQKVVVLEIDGDAQGKLRAQIESALKAAGTVELVSLKSFKDAAAKKKLKGAAAMTPVGVARASKIIRLDAAVGGEVTASTYKVLIYDRAGEQLWSALVPPGVLQHVQMLHPSALCCNKHCCNMCTVLQRVAVTRR
jgi:hypothetical protein